MNKLNIKFGLLNTLIRVYFYIRALLIFSFSLYLEASQILMGNKQLTFQNILYDVGEW